MGHVDYTDYGIFIVANAFRCFFKEVQVKYFWSSLAVALPGADLMFDAKSKLGASILIRSLKSASIVDVE